MEHHKTPDLEIKSGQSCHLAGKYQAEQDGDGELAVAEEDDVEEVRVGGMLEEKPEAEILRIFNVNVRSEMTGCKM